MYNNKQQQWQGVLKHDEPMSRHTSWRVGGCAERYYQPVDLEDLKVFLRSLTDAPALTWIGLGSNTLVRDGGISGVVINITGILNKIDFHSNFEVYVEAGVASPKLARATAKRGLSGLEFLSGIPGTIGGALAMNAGCMGSEIWEYVKQVVTLDGQGEEHIRNKDEYTIAYRSVKGVENEYFVAATFRLHAGDSQKSEKIIKEYLARRGSTQPTQLPNAGSVFRNPENDYAARLIEESGLKNYCIGGACVSEKHANFIVNTGTASAKDIESLISHVRQTVETKMHVTLHAEVRIIGNEK